MSQFKAWRVHEIDGRFEGAVETRNTADLPAGEVLVRVSHSSLNYKDALSASGHRGVTRDYPHTPGVDAAGRVVESAVSDFAPGDEVIVTGYDLGMNTDGGFGAYIRVPAAWCLAMPPGWDARTAMCYGTAGLTAALSVDKLLKMGLSPGDRPVLVTGASGAVGTVAVELLDRLGLQVEAMTSRADQVGRLRDLGAGDIVGRELLNEQKRPLQKPRYAAVLDTVGGSPLAESLKWVVPGGSVSTCGMVGGTAVNTTVFPFILRGVNLLGVDSVEIPLAYKARMWRNLAGDWRCPHTEASAQEIGLEDLAAHLRAFLEERSPGKVVLRHED